MDPVDPVGPADPAHWFASGEKSKKLQILVAVAKNDCFDTLTHLENGLAIKKHKGNHCFQNNFQKHKENMHFAFKSRPSPKDATGCLGAASGSSGS